MRIQSMTSEGLHRQVKSETTHEQAQQRIPSEFGRRRPTVTHRDDLIDLRSRQVLPHRGTHTNTG